MRTVTFHKQDIHRGYLILINHDYPLSYQPKLYEYQGFLMERSVIALLKELLSKVDLHNELTLVSSYRSFQEQEILYQTSLKENDELFTKQYVAYPHHSEHQSGLAFDIAIKSPHIDFIRPHFPATGTSLLFQENAYRYGFIQRYQRDKEDITQIAEEPWHFRYVGIPHSYIIHEKNWCLEEYINNIKDYSIFNPFHYHIENQFFSLFYVPIKNDSITLQLMDDAFYQVSGNNVDGLILTAWRSYV